jgi:hypothetical protein
MQINKDLGVPFFAELITALTELWIEGSWCWESLTLATRQTLMLTEDWPTSSDAQAKVTASSRAVEAARKTVALSTPIRTQIYLGALGLPWQFFPYFSSVVRWILRYKAMLGHGPHSPPCTAASPKCSLQTHDFSTRICHSGFKP